MPQEEPESEIIEFFNDRSVFITGGTGFLGKVLIEKLLRSCPGINNIYLLIRPKGKKTVDDRISDLLNSTVNPGISLHGTCEYCNCEGKRYFGNG